MLQRKSPFILQSWQCGWGSVATFYSSRTSLRMNRVPLWQSEQWSILWHDWQSRRSGTEGEARIQIHYFPTRWCNASHLEQDPWLADASFWRSRDQSALQKWVAFTQSWPQRLWFLALGLPEGKRVPSHTHNFAGAERKNLFSNLFSNLFNSNPNAWSSCVQFCAAIKQVFWEQWWTLWTCQWLVILCFLSINCSWKMWFFISNALCNFNLYRKYAFHFADF